MICGHLKQPEKQNQASGNITITITIFIKQQPLDDTHLAVRQYLPLCWGWLTPDVSE